MQYAGPRSIRRKRGELMPKWAVLYFRGNQAKWKIFKNKKLALKFRKKEGGPKRGSFIRKKR